MERRKQRTCREELDDVPGTLQDEVWWVAVGRKDLIEDEGKGRLAVGYLGHPNDWGGRLGHLSRWWWCGASERELGRCQRMNLRCGGRGRGPKYS